MELKKEEVKSLEALVLTEGWQVFKDILQKKFDLEYKKLRKCKKSDSTYSQINGFLDGLEFVQTVVENQIDDLEEGQIPD